MTVVGAWQKPRDSFSVVELFYTLKILVSYLKNIFLQLKIYVSFGILWDDVVEC